MVGNHSNYILRYLEVTPVEAHPVDLSTTRPGRVDPIDEFLLVVKVYVDDVVEALRIQRREHRDIKRVIFYF